MSVRWLVLAILCASCVSEAQEQATFAYNGETRVFSYYRPSDASAEALPVVMLLHGSGGSSAGLIRHWIALADKEQIILVAPDSKNRSYWQRSTEPSEFFRDLIEVVNLKHPVQRERVYLFGHSGGAVYALTLAMMQSHYFAAVSVHAGAWRNAQELNIHQLAARAIPVGIVIGSRDPFFPLRDARKTQEVLDRAGHPTLLHVIQRHDHDYVDVAQETNALAWTFLRRFALNEAPRFVIYR